MVTKLKFKGEKTKKRKRTHDDVEHQGTSTHEGNDDQGWVDAESLDDISTGPLFITFQSSPPVALASDPLGRIFASTLKIKEEDVTESTNFEPEDVRQVWIATRIVGGSKISLKSATGKFLSCDKIGLLSASKEAIGPQEEWQPVHRDDGWALQNVFDKFLSVDEVAAGGKVEIRGDAESIGFNETFTLRIQARLRKKTKTTSVIRTEERLSRRELETITGKSLTDEQVKELRKAKKEGRFAGALLDIRSKSKSDKYA